MPKTWTAFENEMMWNSLARTVAAGDNFWALDSAFRNTRLDAMRAAFTWKYGIKAPTNRTAFFIKVWAMATDDMRAARETAVRNAMMMAAAELPEALVGLGVS